MRMSADVSNAVWANNFSAAQFPFKFTCKKFIFGRCSGRPDGPSPCGAGDRSRLVRRLRKAVVVSLSATKANLTYPRGSDNDNVVGECHRLNSGLHVGGEKFLVKYVP